MYPMTNELIRIIHEENLRAALSPRHRWPSEPPRRAPSIGHLRHTVATALRWAATSIDPEPAHP
jgi:hypothetical protein